MKKRGLVKLATMAAVVGSATWGISQVDEGRFDNAINYRSWDVDLGRTVSPGQLKTALSNAAEDMGWDINFTPHYAEGFKLGSVHETSEGD
jgi:hypothetical protein